MSAARTQDKQIALVGSPNCGKSTIFNALTGLRQKIANFPGVTVEPKLGIIPADNHTTINLIDLPGIYSAIPKTPDEELALSVLDGTHNRLSKPDCVLFVLEGTNIEKSLFLFAQLARYQIPTIVVVTMIDAIKASGGALDDIELERQLGVPVIGVVGHKGVGFDEIKTMILDGAAQPPCIADNNILTTQSGIEDHHQWAREVAREVAHIPDEDNLTKKLDAVLLHPVFGPIVFLGVMLLFFQSIFTWASPVMDLIEGVFAKVQEFIVVSVPPGIIQNFLSRGIIAGVGSVLVFLPQIIILTLCISILEDFGYLSRAAFLVDRLMGFFGLQGRSFVPLLGSFACAIPGIMSARIIPSEKDRLTTILIAPLMTCSARLPVYILLITAFIPDTMFAGFLGLRGMVLMGLYFVAALSGLFIAKIFKSTLFRGSKLPFLMELPPYRFPMAKNVFITVFNRAKAFITSAGTTILALSIILWALSEFPRVHISPSISAPEAEKLQLEYSLLGRIGKNIEPVFSPIGFDWKITLGVLSSFAARETFVSVMGQLYSVDVSESDTNLRTVLQRSITLPVALSILAFYVYALQCMSTIAIIKRETGTWKYPVFAFFYMLILAYSSAFVTYRLAVGWG